MTNVVEWDEDGNMKEVEGGELFSPSSLQLVPITPSTVGVMRMPNPGEVQLTALETPPRSVASIIKTRQGRGGEITYIPWPAASDLLDYAFGPGGWSVEVENQTFETRVDTGRGAKPGDLVYEYMVKCRCWASVMGPHYWTIYGWGNYYSKDDSAHRAEALEAAVSRCVTKFAARLSVAFRKVWAKDDLLVKAVTPASPAQISSCLMMIEQVGTDAAKMVQIKTELKVLGVMEISKEAMKVLTMTQVAELNGKIAKLMEQGG